MRYNTAVWPELTGTEGENEMDLVRFGIIGMGVQGGLYADILTGNQHPGRTLIPRPEHCVLTAVSSRSERTGEEARRLGVKWFRDWKGLIDSGVCDAVILTVPHFLHHEVAVYALNRGVNVLCEKPAGVRASDVMQMIEAEKRSTACLGMFLQQRTIPLFQTIKAIVDSGELGALRRSNWIINTYWRPDSYYASAAWRGTWKGEGGGLLVNQLPHYLDLWLYLCGTPAKIYALNRHGAYRSIAVENDVTVLAEYPDGTTGVFVACTHDPMGTDRLEMDFEQGKIVVEDSCRAKIHRFHRSDGQWNESVTAQQMHHLIKRGHEHHDTQDIAEGLPYGVRHGELMENFALHILYGVPLIATGADGLHQVQLANAIQLSGWLREEVANPCDMAAYDRELKKRMDEE